MKKIRFFLTGLLLMVGCAAFAQNIAVKGTVTDAESGEPVVGAAVVLQSNNATYAITDVSGNYAIGVPKDGVLEVSYLGYVKQAVAVEGRSQVNIMLTPDAQDLEEVLVVAFGTAKKSSFTGSAAVVDAEDLQKVQVSSITNALQGKVSGVQLISANGAPGESASIRIRGIGSINAGKNPLYIVDGAPYDGDMANFNQADIESMTVLKDAASNALYGARGANGVIMITTKKAKRGNADITLDAKYGVNTRALKDYEVITDPAEYYEVHYKSVYNYAMDKQGMTADEAWEYANSVLFDEQGNGGLGYNVYTIPEGEFLIGRDGKLNPNATLGNLVNWNGEDFLVTPDNWSDYGYRNGARQEYNLSISQAFDKVSVLASLGYLNEQGITEKSDFSRMSGRLRADYQAKKWLKTGVNASFAHYEKNYLDNNGSPTSTGNIWAFTSSIAPIYPLFLRNADGSIKIDDAGNQVLDYGNAKYGEGGNAGFSRPFLSDANAIQDNRLNTLGVEGNAFTANGYLDITLCKGLVLTVNGSVYSDEYRTTEVLNPYYGQFNSTGGTVYKAHSRLQAYNLQQLLNYTNSFGENNLNVMLGHEYYDYTSYSLSATKHQMFSPTDKELARAVVDNSSAYSSKGEYNNEGYFGRAMYDYSERYFFSASLRADASSRFHPDHRWGMFWSVGGAWLINKEEWFGADWVNELKIKASYGTQGNDNISSYLYTDQYSISNSDGAVGVSFTSKGTEDITWEKRKNFNVGAEFTLFNRLSGSVEYYYNKTTDMLFSFSVAPSAGYTSYYDNVGDLYNKGVEVELNYDIFKRKNFTWNIYGNISFQKNRITYLHEDKKTTTYRDLDGNVYDGYTSGSFFLSEGASMYTWRLKEYAGVDPEDGQSLWYKEVPVYVQVADPTTGEMVDTEEIDHYNLETTNKYADASYFVSNKTTLPDAFGGFGTSFKFYGFDISASFSYQLGGYQYDYTYASFMSTPLSSSTGNNIHVDALNAWSAENPDSNIPRWNFDDTYSAGSSTRFLTSSSYLNLDNVVVGYTFPSKWFRNSNVISSLRLYVMGGNLWYLSARQGFDPRQSFSDSSDASNYSPMRTISGGVTVKF